MFATNPHTLLSPPPASIKKIRIEPSYSAGDCGYKVLIIGLLYLSLKEEKNSSKILENKDLSTILTSKPNGLYQWLMNSRLIKGDVSNAEILRAFVNGLKDRFAYSLDEFYEEITPKIKLASSRSEWLFNMTKEMLINGLWDAYDNIHQVPAIKNLESKIIAKTSDLMEDRINVSLDEIDSLKATARKEIMTSISESQLKAIIQEVIKHLFLKKDVWLDLFFLKQLGNQLLGSENIFFDENGIKINDKGTQRNHWHIDLPDDSFSQYLVKTCHLTVNNSFSVQDHKQSDDTHMRPKSP